MLDLRSRCYAPIALIPLHHQSRVTGEPCWRNRLQARFERQKTVTAIRYGTLQQPKSAP